MTSRTCCPMTSVKTLPVHSRNALLTKRYRRSQSTYASGRPSALSLRWDSDARLADDETLPTLRSTVASPKRVRDCDRAIGRVFSWGGARFLQSFGKG